MVQIQCQNSIGKGWVGLMAFNNMLMKCIVYIPSDMSSEDAVLFIFKVKEPGFYWAARLYKTKH